MESERGGEVMKKKLFAIPLLALVLLIPIAYSARTPSSTTIPPITATSAGVYFQCAPLQAFPGSVVIGSSGFILVSCSNQGALSLDGTLTPTFTLGIGYIDAGIIFSSISGNPCNLHFRSLAVGIGNVTVPTGSLLNRTLTFSSNPVQGNMLTASYNYCLQYTNAPATGLPGFSIVWT
jgi:hypothetical protein